MREKLQRYLTTKNILLVLFFLGLVVQWPIYTFPHSEYSLIEILLLIICAIWFLRPTAGEASLQKNQRDPLVGLFLLWAIWALFLWTISTDWSYNLNEIRWLFLSVGALIFLRDIGRTDWRGLVATFLAAAVLAALIADIQGLTGIFQPPFSTLTTKEIFLGAEEYVNQSVAVGFFRHPNAFGGFVFWPFLILVGMLPKRKNKILAILGILFFGTSLYLSYYRTMLLGLAFALFVFALLRSRLPSRLVGLGILGAGVLGILGAVVALKFFPTIGFFGNLWYRIDLWDRSLVFLRQEPVILLFGSGFAPSAGLLRAQARIDPHNAFFYMVMHYGLTGLLFFLAVMWMVIRKGWQAYKDGVFSQEPILAALWAGWIAWFLTDFVDSRLTTPEWQMLFVAVLAIYWGGLKFLRTPSETPGLPTIIRPPT